MGTGDPGTMYFVLYSAKEVFAMNDYQKKKFAEKQAIEWTTLLQKGAVRVHGPEAAAEIRARYKSRIMGSRFVGGERAGPELPRGPFAARSQRARHGDLVSGA